MKFSINRTKGPWTLVVTLSTFLFITISFANASAVAKKDDHAWCYKDPNCAPNLWTGQCKEGKYQSPIDIKKTEKKEKLTRLRFNKQYMDIQNHFFVKNNGHTVQVQLNEDYSSKLLMDGDGLKGSYIFSQLHLHWGDHDDVGSEHTVKGRSYPAELHLVHYGATYKSLGDAVSSKNPRALAVLGIFLEISSEENTALKPVIEQISNVIDGGSDKLFPIHSALNVSALLPSNLSLYRYYGSLTTPSCSEIVHWNLFSTSVPISRSQLSALQILQDGHQLKLSGNFRPTLPLLSRKVFEYDQVVGESMPETGMRDDSTPGPDITDDYNEIFKGIEGKQESSDKGKKSSADTTKVQSISHTIVSVLMSITIPVVMKLYQ